MLGAYRAFIIWPLDTEKTLTGCQFGRWKSYDVIAQSSSCAQNKINGIK